MVSFFLDVTPREKAFLGWLGRPKEKRVDEIVAGLAGLVKLFSPRTEELLSNIRGSIWHQTVPRPSVSMGFRKMFRERDMLPGKLHLSLSFNWIFVSLVLARIHPFWNVKHDLAVIEFSHRLRYDRTIQVRKSEKKESGITASISIFGCHREFIVWLSFWPLARVPSRVICSPLFSLSLFFSPSYSYSILSPVLASSNTSFQTLCTDCCLLSKCITVAHKGTFPTGSD